MSTETTNGKTASPSINNNNNTPTSSSSESSPGGASLAFNERNFSAKLDAVAPTQDSIQSLGLWILHHKFNHEAICRIWLDKLTDSSSSSKQKLALFYLANEVIQNCRRKNARIFQESFKKILPRAIEIVGRSESIVKNVERVLDVWLEREVYDRDFINKLISKLQEEKSKILNSPDQATTEALKSNKPPPNHHHHNTSPKTSTVSNNHKHQSEKAASSHHNQEKIDSSSIEEIIAEFQVKKLCESLLDFNETIKETNAKKSQVDSTRIVDISSDHVKQYRDKTQCGKFKAEFENSCIKLEEFLVKLEAQAKQRIELVRLMEKSEIFYEAQFNDAKTVNNAYRVFGSKVHTMKKKLDEYVLEKFDNKEISDMEMSDEESTVNNTNNNHTSASQKPTMPPRPSQNGGGGSIKTHLDPRQSRKASSSSNMNDSRSKQTSSSSTNSSSQQKTSPSGGQKRKSEAEDESSTSMGKNSRSSKDDPFDFLSKLINKSASMQPSNIPSTGSGGVEATTNPNLSFLVSSLQKFVNSGNSSTGNPSTGNTTLQQQASLEYNPANVGGGSYYDDPYMLMNAGVPPPPPPGTAPAYYPGNHAANSQPLSIAAAAPFHHPFYHHPLASPGATQPQPPHQLMEIDTHSYAAATAQLASFASGPNSPSAPNPAAATNQISPLMALKADEFVTMPQSIDPQSPHHPRHFSHHHQPLFNKHTPEQFEVYDYEYDPTQTGYPNSPFQPQQQHQQRFEKKRFYGGSGGGGGGQNRRNSYHTNFDYDQNTANSSSGYQPYNRFQRVNSYQETNNLSRPNTNNRPINPKSPAGFGQQKNGTADFNNSPSSNRFPNNNNRYA